MSKTIKKLKEHSPSTAELMNLDYKFQPELTVKLDGTQSEFDQSVINEIVLWKTNRYAQLSTETLKLVNKIDPNSDAINLDLTHKVLTNLLKTKGVRLPMASTILRFRNPYIYQIIDQRVFRLLYGYELILKTYINDKNINENINRYLDYLVELKNTCDEYQIPFTESDRIFYAYDKKVNKKNIN